jgi:hypothetical protein
VTDVCPQCSQELLTGQDVKRRAAILYCPNCGPIEPDRKAFALKIPGLDPGPAHKRLRGLENRIVKQVYEALRNRGYTAVRLGQRNARLGGNDKGAPDLIYTRREWDSLWGAFEVKTEDGNHSGRPEQEEFAVLGLTRVVRSVGEAIAIAEATRARLEGLVKA